MFTTKKRLGASPSETPAPSRRDDFARAAVYEEFRSRNARALDQGDFRDRQPGLAPRPIGQNTAKVADDTGMKAAQHWLGQAAEADSNEERAAALEIARQIARLAGLPWADVLGRREAA